MSKESYHAIPSKCPVTGEPLYVSELKSEGGAITIRGKFALPQAVHLEEDHQRLLELFLRSRGVISTMEKELGLSYPTVRGRIDGLLEAMGLEPIRTEAKDEKMAEKKRKILKMLEEGKISATEAKTKLKELQTK